MINERVAGEAWTSTVGIGEAARLFRSAARVVVMTHAKPDGDAVGSTLAVARTMQSLGAHVELWYISPLPPWVPQLAGTAARSGSAGGTNHREIDPESAFSAGGAEPELVVVVDTGTWTQVSAVREWLRARVDRVLVIDHHVRGDTEMSARRLLDVTAASCTQVLAPVCVEALGVGSASRLPVEIAEALYLGLATDTGWFKYSSVTGATMRLTADLLDAGVDHTRLYQLIEQSDTFGRWKLLARALATAERWPLRTGGEVSIMHLRDADFREVGATRNDTGGFADMVMTVQSVRASALLIEPEPGEGERGGTQGEVKVSIRSKHGAGAVDVNAAMATLGGGGHVRAAGAKVIGTIEQVRAKVLAAVGVAGAGEP